MMLPTSIRWRLPLSYAMIALVATLVLGVVLLTRLRGYYADREYDHLRANAQAIGNTVTEMYGYRLSNDQIQAQLQSLSFLAQSNVRVLDTAGKVLIESGAGSEPRTIALTYSRRATAQSGFMYNFDQNDFPPIAGQTSGQMAGDSNPDWRSSIDIGPRMVTAPVPPFPQNVEKQLTRRFFVAVAGTPYGFGLNGDGDVFWGDIPRSDTHFETPIFDPTHKLIGFVELSDGPAYGTEIVNGVARSLIGAGVIAILMAAAIGWVISRQMSQPLLNLADVTRKMADGNLSARVVMERDDEFGLLAKSFNHMANQVEHTVVALRRFVADAAHEIHTPVTALHANLELAATDDDPAQRLIFVQRAQEQLKRLETMTSSLLDLSRLESGALQDERTPVDMTLLVAQVSELYASRAEQSGLSFQIDAPHEPVIVRVNESQLRRVVGNLLDNAIKFTPETGVIRVGLCRESKSVQISVQDTGIGIPTEDLPHLFNRFRRGRNAASYPGSGLGLAIIKAIVEGHGGQVMVESSPRGTCFSLSLPTPA
ncbi:MAG: HAMP domain-containing sensor histidine kinase [Chloroflexota bacterium]